MLPRLMSPRWFLALLMLPFVGAASAAKEGDPIAIRFWPDEVVTIETMWNLHIAIGNDPSTGATEPVADVDLQVAPAKENPFRFHGQSMTGKQMILDRLPGKGHAIFGEATPETPPSANALQLQIIDVAEGKKKASGAAVHVRGDGVSILYVDGVSAPALESLAEKRNGDAWAIDVVLCFATAENRARMESLKKFIDSVRPGTIAIAAGKATDAAPFLSSLRGDRDLGVSPVGNTLAASKGKRDERASQIIHVATEPWSMPAEIAELFSKKERACRASQAVFRPLSVRQMNFQPANGTHTPRWNAEHMMGRELLFFSQIYAQQNHAIPVLDLNPAQMPPDYRAAHPDWDGAEEARQMERVSAFTRRFAYLLEGMELGETAPGSFWTPRALLKQMERHYDDHTANVTKKFDLPDWPSGN